MQQNPSKTPVSLAHCADYDPQALAGALREMLQPLGGIEHFVSRGDRVLLKPNLVVARPAQNAVSTHPEILRQVARLVLDAGGHPFIGDSPAFGTARSVCEANGIAAVADELGIEIRDLGHKPLMRPLGDDAPRYWTRFGRDALEAESIINLPKVKAHCQTGMTLAVKNLYGVVSGKRKAWYHLRSGNDLPKFCRLLCAVSRKLAPALSIADGIVALERNGPTQGDPRPLGILAASPDPVALDRVLLDLLAVDPDHVPLIAAARQMNYGETRLEHIALHGTHPDALRAPDFQPVTELSPISFSPLRVARSVLRQGVQHARLRLRRQTG